MFLLLRSYLVIFAVLFQENAVHRSLHAIANLCIFKSLSKLFIFYQNTGQVGLMCNERRTRESNLYYVFTKSCNMWTVGPL